MGASQSKSTVEQLSVAITNVAASVIQECIVDAKVSQNAVFNIDDATFQGNTVSMSQSTTVNTQCFGNSSLEMNLQNDIVEAIKNVSSAQGVGISSASQESSLRTLVENSITLKNVQKNYTALSQDQNLFFNFTGGLIKDNTFDMNQGASVFSAAVLKTVSDVGLLNSISTKIDAAAQAKGVSLADFLPDVGQLAMIAAIGIVGLVGFMMVRGSVSQRR